MLRSIFIFIICSLAFLCQGQDHFLVEFEAFSPPEKALIAQLKGFPAESFLAKDLEGKEHFLQDYRGKTVILFFYSVVDNISYDWLTKLNLLQVQYLDELQVFGFAKEERDVISSATADNAILFPNFPNGTKFGEMAYSGDLGMGRIIIIDKNGIIKEVIPRSFFNRNSSVDLLPKVEKIVSQIIFQH